MMRRRDLLLSLVAGTAGALLAPRRALSAPEAAQEARPRTGRFSLHGGGSVGWVEGEVLTAQEFADALNSLPRRAPAPIIIDLPPWK